MFWVLVGSDWFILVFFVVVEFVEVVGDVVEVEVEVELECFFILYM